MVFRMGFMPSNHYSGSDTSRPEMGIMGIMNRARGMQIVENVFHVRMMFLLLGLFLSIVNLPIASGESDPSPPPNDLKQPPIAPSPLPSAGPDPRPPPAPAQQPPPAPAQQPPPPFFTSFIPPPPSPPSVAHSPSPGGPSPTPGVSLSPPELGPPPPPDTWNESEKAGVVIASIAALLQVAVVAFLLIKRHQMLTTVEYDDIEDLEYDTPPDSNFRDIESA